MRMIGYFRVPPAKGAAFDGPQSQRLFDAGCDQLFHDSCYGLAVHKPGLETALAATRAGDVLVVSSLHTFAAHLVDLLLLLGRLQASGIELVALAEKIDTREPGRFFKVCAQLTLFHEQRRMVRTAEEKIAREGRLRAADA